MKALFSDHMTMKEHTKPIEMTALGQAHFGGTGPDGATCRECSKWLKVSKDGFSIPHEYRGIGGGHPRGPAGALHLSGIRKSRSLRPSRRAGLPPLHLVRSAATGAAA